MCIYQYKYIYIYSNNEVIIVYMLLILTPSQRLMFLFLRHLLISSKQRAISARTERCFKVQKKNGTSYESNEQRIKHRVVIYIYIHP